VINTRAPGPEQIGRLKRPLRDHSGRLLDPTVIGGLAAGVAVMYITGLLVIA
jgi:hypothetical protein